MLKTMLLSVLASGVFAAGQADLADEVLDRINDHYAAVVSFADAIRAGGRPTWQVPVGPSGRAGGSRAPEVVSFVMFRATAR